MQPGRDDPAHTAPAGHSGHAHSAAAALDAATARPRASAARTEGAAAAVLEADIVSTRSSVDGAAAAKPLAAAARAAWGAGSAPATQARPAQANGASSRMYPGRMSSAPSSARPRHPRQRLQDELANAASPAPAAAAAAIAAPVPSDVTKQPSSPPAHGSAMPPVLLSPPASAVPPAEQETPRVRWSPSRAEGLAGRGADSASDRSASKSPRRSDSRSRRRRLSHSRSHSCSRSRSRSNRKRPHSHRPSACTSDMEPGRLLGAPDGPRGAVPPAHKVRRGAAPSPRKSGGLARGRSGSSSERPRGRGHTDAHGGRRSRSRQGERAAGQHNPALHASSRHRDVVAASLPSRSPISHRAATDAVAAGGSRDSAAIGGLSPRRPVSPVVRALYRASLQGPERLSPLRSRLLRSSSSSSEGGNDADADYADGSPMPNSARRGSGALGGGSRAVPGAAARRGRLGLHEGDSSDTDNSDPWYWLLKANLADRVGGVVGARGGGLPSTSSSSDASGAGRAGAKRVGGAGVAPAASGGQAAGRRPATPPRTYEVTATGPAWIAPREYWRDAGGVVAPPDVSPLAQPPGRAEGRAAPTRAAAPAAAKEEARCRQPQRPSRQQQRPAQPADASREHTPARRRRSSHRHKSSRSRSRERRRCDDSAGGGTPSRQKDAAHISVRSSRADRSPALRRLDSRGRGGHGRSSAAGAHDRKPPGCTHVHAVGRDGSGCGQSEQLRPDMRKPAGAVATAAASVAAEDAESTVLTGAAAAVLPAAVTATAATAPAATEHGHPGDPGATPSGAVVQPMANLVAAASAVPVVGAYGDGGLPQRPHEQQPPSPPGGPMATQPVPSGAVTDVDISAATPASEQLGIQQSDAAGGRAHALEAAAAANAGALGSPAGAVPPAPAAGERAFSVSAVEAVDRCPLAGAHTAATAAKPANLSASADVALAPAPARAGQAAAMSARPLGQAPVRGPVGAHLDYPGPGAAALDASASVAGAAAPAAGAGPVPSQQAPIQVIITGPTTFVTADGSGAGAAAAASASAVTALLRAGGGAAGVVDLRHLQAAPRGSRASGHPGPGAAAAAGAGPGAGVGSSSPAAAAAAAAGAAMPAPRRAPALVASAASGLPFAVGGERRGSLVAPGGRASYPSSAASSVYGDLHVAGSSSGSLASGVWRRNSGSDGSVGGGDSRQGGTALTHGSVGAGGEPWEGRRPHGTHSKPPVLPPRQASSTTAEIASASTRHHLSHAVGFIGQRDQGVDGGSLRYGVAEGSSAQGPRQHMSGAWGAAEHAAPTRLEHDPHAHRPHPYSQRAQRPQQQQHQGYPPQPHDEHTWAASRAPVQRSESARAAAATAPVATRGSGGSGGGGGGTGGGAAWAPPHLLSGAVDTRGSVVSVIPLQAAAAAAAAGGSGLTGAVEVTVRLVPPPHQQRQHQHQNQLRQHRRTEHGAHSDMHDAGVHGARLPYEGAQWQYGDAAGAERWARDAAGEPPHGATAFLHRQLPSQRHYGNPPGAVIGTAPSGHLAAAAEQVARTVPDATQRFTAKGDVVLAAAAPPPVPLQETLVWRAGHRESGTTAPWAVQVTTAAHPTTAAEPSGPVLRQPPPAGRSSDAGAAATARLHQPAWGPGDTGDLRAAGPSSSAVAPAFASSSATGGLGDARSHSPAVGDGAAAAGWAGRGPGSLASQAAIVPRTQADVHVPAFVGLSHLPHGARAVGGGGGGATRVDLSNGRVLAVLRAQQSARHVQTYLQKGDRNSP
ncbi:hypothetical protein HYH02_004177 [Chlamydomonas schloesseri]|uniref:Uncharacterized protein n=1 Tax=Chlamydomonas schloesseri TaxID=2026947 RepID=A0A835WQJ2_9CHLO|nr:hypothetical protein HYH02_004177 [Chlamydomonas schloesseri]|eukprot:KAG2451579.1 hypothetical protein HYH02_004177 [Chlamydomonas schloesseri]